MNMKDVGGSLAIIGCTGLIGFEMWLTQSAESLWAIMLLILFSCKFPWSTKDSKKSDKEE